MNSMNIGLFTMPEQDIPDKMVAVARPTTKSEKNSLLSWAKEQGYEAIDMITYSDSFCDEITKIDTETGKVISRRYVEGYRGDGNV